MDLSQLFKGWGESEELLVSLVFVPGKDWKGVFWLEHVGCRRVVDNDHILYISPQSGDVLNECIVEEDAVLAVKLVGTDVQTV